MQDFIHWVAVLACLFASVKHFIFLPSVVKDSPAFAITPAIKWWAGYAFAAMNFSFFTIGLYVGIHSSYIGKKAFLLGVANLYLCFATTWIIKGDTTGNANYAYHGFKMYLYGFVFLFGFFL